ncbi:MAG: retropepsin-like domain-containing protein, partial [Candidatus Eremiobacteraeota bacterium]|nr:retropepsin-like domain-containing protein [Candidatus Eremiobacteraeota bacterium]
SSQNTSIIDRDVAAELHLPTYGQAMHLSTGGSLAYRTTIADATVGPIHLKNFAVDATDISYEIAHGVKVVGILGYDFLSTNVFHIDYVHELVEVIPSNDFTAAVPVPGILDLPFKLDDGVPLVPMQIGDTLTNDVVVNCGFPITMVFGALVSAHPDQFKDVDSRERHETFIPFADGGSFGTKAEVWFSEPASLRFAIANYQLLPIVTTNFPAGSIDAMIGLDYLQYFDLYFDYPHDRFLVLPNKWFFNKFKLHA